MEYYKKLRKDLLDTLRFYGVEDVIHVTRGGLTVNTEAIQCDYYECLNGNRQFAPIEYMTQYSFGEAGFRQGLGFNISQKCNESVTDAVILREYCFFMWNYVIMMIHF